MKQILLIAFSIITISCNAQIYPLNYKEDVPNGAYYKDLDGELNKYVGLWKGTWSNGKTIYLELKKFKDYSDGNRPYYKDRILGERKIVASNGVVEIDRISNFGNDGTEFWGMGFNLKNGNIKRLYFNPKNMCGKRSTLDITNFTGSQMTLHFEYLPSNIDSNCQLNAYVDQYGDFPINFPKDIVLTKQ